MRLICTKIGILTAFTFLVSSCMNEWVKTSEEKTQVNLTASINHLSRTPQMDENGGGTFQKDDELGIVVSSGNQFMQNLDFHYDSRLYWEDITLTETRTPVDNNTKVGFVGYYPISSFSVNSASAKFDVTTAQDKDLLLAARQEVTYMSQESIVLGFSHAMHRLDISFTSSDHTYTEEELSKIATVCHAYSTCTVDLLNGSINTPADKKDYSSVTGKSVQLYIIPQKKSDVSLKFTIGNKVKEVALTSVDIQNTSDDSLLGGKVLKIQLDVRRNGVFVNGANIAGWENQGSVSGSIIV